MKHLFTILLALTCATSFAQSVIVKATGAGAVRGTTIAIQTVESVTTNLIVTGELDPIEAVGSNYVWVGTCQSGFLGWSNAVNNFCISPISSPATTYVIYQDWNAPPHWKQFTEYTGVPTGTYSAIWGTTGTATVAYWYQTNYSTSATVTVQGKVTP